ncbi:hypothetical protein LTR37_009701 [Vermiconidia calcicola]|uniref:Uncharacterized protein n=1 Tax=Vermiconidia calcicola TaxID=1690605 RepID=A0ACC3N6W8_9PEZI|nr:hypothetical protein LTR37_009701 [Vermiconidia calcicola]
MSKPITLYSHPGGPNPWKVAIILEELKLSYETKIMDFGELKKDPFEKLNPNGRVPVIEDANTNITLWESGAIIEYLLETYDKDNNLSYEKSPEKYEQKCWMHFQMSGQGPYFGQRAWFVLYHPENIDSCLERYGNEIRRVLGVIDSHLKKTGREYLVGDKCSYADLAFVPWHWLLISPPHIMGENFAQEWEKEYPTCWKWSQTLLERPSVKKCRENRQKAIEASKK